MRYLRMRSFPSGTIQIIHKYQNGELTEYELVNKIFEPFEQVSQVQAQLLGVTFEMLSGGPAQTHIGIGGGGSSSDMPWEEKKNDNKMTISRRKLSIGCQQIRKRTFFK